MKFKEIFEKVLNEDMFSKYFGKISNIDKDFNDKAKLNNIGAQISFEGGDYPEYEFEFMIFANEGDDMVIMDVSIEIDADNNELTGVWVNNVKSYLDNYSKVDEKFASKFAEEMMNEVLKDGVTEFKFTSKAKSMIKKLNQFWSKK